MGPDKAEILAKIKSIEQIAKILGSNYNRIAMIFNFYSCEKFSDCDYFSVNI
jgi:hypothetical protein